MMGWSYDSDADAAYLALASERTAARSDSAHDVVVDYDADDRIVGIEILHASRRLPDAVIHPEAAE
ncbi:DUF2283 domain-containing protein [Marinicauda sp. Alg238-R41]|uniref:DUF2283 domain-containing protein n=1 Tax=Marinicauda sp. Alg238-R41 TaxID=2993447 RepID=UPI0022E2B5FA|nr:DUF2283 domain-containing protein [Marinicauda sp. Alg238-R41]